MHIGVWGFDPSPQARKNLLSGGEKENCGKQAKIGKNEATNSKKWINRENSKNLAKNVYIL